MESSNGGTRICWSNVGKIAGFHAQDVPGDLKSLRGACRGTANMCSVARVTGAGVTKMATASGMRVN